MFGRKTTISILAVFIVTITALFVWIVLPDQLCGDNDSKMLTYSSDETGTSFVYLSSLCILEDDRGYLIELSRSKLPSDFYKMKEYETEALRETLRIGLGLSQRAQRLDGKVSFYFKVDCFV